MILAIALKRQIEFLQTVLKPIRARPNSSRQPVRRGKFSFCLLPAKPELSCVHESGNPAGDAKYGWSERKASALPTHLPGLYALLVDNGSRCVFVAMLLPTVSGWFLLGVIKSPGPTSKIPSSEVDIDRGVIPAPNSDTFKRLPRKETL